MIKHGNFQSWMISLPHFTVPCLILNNAKRQAMQRQVLLFKVIGLTWPGLNTRGSDPMTYQIGSIHSAILPTPWPDIPLGHIVRIKGRTVATPIYIYPNFNYFSLPLLWVVGFEPRTCRLEPWPSQTNDVKIDICSYLTRHSTLIELCKDWLAQCQINTASNQWLKNWYLSLPNQLLSICLFVCCCFTS